MTHSLNDSNHSFASETMVSIQCDADIVAARLQGRTMADAVGFTSNDVTLIATAISELTRNILQYAGRGQIALGLINHGERAGIVVVARDDGPGIPDVSQALVVGYSTSRGLGLGLPGVRRLMDSFEIVSEVGRGTTVTVVKWKR